MGKQKNNTVIREIAVPLSGTIQKKKKREREKEIEIETDITGSILLNSEGSCCRKH